MGWWLQARRVDLRLMVMIVRSVYMRVRIRISNIIISSTTSSSSRSSNSSSACSSFHLDRLCENSRELLGGTEEEDILLSLPYRCNR